MTGDRMELELKAVSTEGIHDFIVLLEKVIEDIKGGHEGPRVSMMPSAKVNWTITPKQ